VSASVKAWQVTAFLDFPTGWEVLDLQQRRNPIHLDGRIVTFKCVGHPETAVECDSSESARNLVAQIPTDKIFWIRVGEDGVRRMRCDHVGGCVRGMGLSKRETAALARTHTRVNADTWVKAPHPSAGIFYVVCNPQGWGIYPYRFDRFPEIGHPEFWETVVAPVLARRWRPNNPPRFRELEAKLLNHPYGLPRGRIAEVGRQFVVYHGNDFSGLVERDQIEGAFDIQKRCRWQFDDHERCLTADKDEVRAHLGIKGGWPAA
jgi:hypothetical protein